VSNLSKSQQGLLSSLIGGIQGDIGKNPEGYDQLLAQLLGGNSDLSRQMSERMFTEGLMAPALRAFDQSVAPRINAGFSRIGGIQNSRRGIETANALTTLQTNAQGQLAQLLPQIFSFPLQQTLAQIQGLGALQSARYTPYQIGSSLALSPTQQTVQTQQGAGWGLLSAGLGAAGFALGGPLGRTLGGAVSQTASGAASSGWQGVGFGT